MPDLSKTSETGSVTASGVGPHLSTPILVIPAPLLAEMACGNAWIEVIGHDAADKSIGFSITWQVFFAYDGTTLSIKRVHTVVPLWVDPALTAEGFPDSPLEPVVTVLDGCPALAVQFGGPGVASSMVLDVDVSYEKLQAGAS